MSMVRHVTPVRPELATGIVAEVYRQVDKEFSSIGPAVRIMSPMPEALAAGWAMIRESQLTGSAPMRDKAIVALGVAQALDCDYDSVSWIAALELAGETRLAADLREGRPPADEYVGALLEWARASARGPVPARPFPSELTAEFVGTLLFTHLIDRLTHAMLPQGLLPGSLTGDEPPPFEDAPVFRDVLRKRAAGAGLELLDEPPEELLPEWAGDTPAGAAFAGLVAAATEGAALLSERAEDLVATVIAKHEGWAPGVPVSELLADLPFIDRATAELAVLAALAPARITDTRVAAWQEAGGHGDRDTVALLVYGAMAAVLRVEKRVVA
ncbi:hypothetical protein BAY61_12585 [Prauserella marina]|uniref:Uncharacterized protein n=1 Tax=Prauserella marina TaxID=530584 RepID=A0A222VPP3_9PSEU|nr:hypothetical protein [Prauserella marina]ASR35701.1 hypothetical protein BAY61_12585 [Prauserella marina]PWV84422.1 hypothetical protein DES30_101439 [Prauserella marina]SDC22954.1 hypothetical protein SAMN05421630_101898 [Prauserella marina]